MGKWDDYKTYSGSAGTARHSRNLAAGETERKIGTSSDATTAKPPAPEKREYDQAELAGAISAVVGLALDGQKLPINIAEPIAVDGDFRSAVIAGANSKIAAKVPDVDKRVTIAMHLVDLQGIAQATIEAA